MIRPLPPQWSPHDLKRRAFRPTINPLLYLTFTKSQSLWRAAAFSRIICDQESRRASPTSPQIRACLRPARPTRRLPNAPCIAARYLPAARTDPPGARTNTVVGTHQIDSLLCSVSPPGGSFSRETAPGPPLKERGRVSAPRTRARRCLGKPGRRVRKNNSPRDVVYLFPVGSFGARLRFIPSAAPSSLKSPVCPFSALPGLRLREAESVRTGDFHCRPYDRTSSRSDPGTGRPVGAPRPEAGPVLFP